MTNAIITAENLGKRYKLRHEAQVPYQTLREALTAKARRVFSAGRPDAHLATHEDFWALRDINFEIHRGDVVGIIGRNGAGKSTLLKLISRIIEPSQGRITLRGRIASLLEVGTGFHPELTGRENIYLNGAILGMSRREIGQAFDSIVDFAEVSKFLDTPVKRYSSGMYVRLAFAVASHLEPEVLVVDEVLAVGDNEFQKKCLGKMKEVATGGRTVVFVSHTMHAIATLCTRAVLLDKGEVIFDGQTQECVRRYLAAGQQGTSSWSRSPHVPSRPLQFVKVQTALEGTQPTHALTLSVALQSTSAHAAALIAVDIRDQSGITVMQALPEVKGFIAYSHEPQLVQVKVLLPPLIPGSYSLGLWLGAHHNDTLDHVSECGSFEVVDSPSLGRTYPHYSAHGYIVPPSTAQLCSVRQT